MDLYNILELDNTCSQEDIRKAYKKLAFKYHPDKHLDNKLFYEEKFKKISEAYQILSNEKMKKEYDISGNININDLKDPLDLFNNIYDNLQNAFHKTDIKNFKKIFQNIDKTSLIKDSVKLLNYYFISKSYNETENNNIKTKNNIKIDLSKLNLNKDNKIKLDLNIFYNFKNINIDIIDKTESYVLNLNTEFSSHNIQIKDKLYNFKLLDCSKSLFKRVNSYDLIKNIEIGLLDYFEGFLLILDTYKDSISRSINLINNKSMIIKLEKYGLPIWSKNKFGDLYINFHIIPKIKRLHNPPLSNYTLNSINFKEIIENINLYNI